MRLLYNKIWRAARAGGWRRWILGLYLITTTGALRAQTASFSLSATSVTTSGWTNVAGDPSTGVWTATASGITLSSVATANWSPYSGNSAKNGSGKATSGYFPSNVMAGNWFQYNGSGRSLALYNQLTPQLELSGLNPDSTYVLQLSGSDTSSLMSNPTIYTVAGAANYGSQILDDHNNSANGVVFRGITPNGSGVISIYVNASTGTDLAAICGIRIYPGSSGPASPSVAITAPASGSVWAEGVNVGLIATASETGGTISKVVFYADTSTIATVTSSPYTHTWADPDPGGYTIIAMATDNNGTVNSASIAVGIKPLNDFWSLTGNVGNNADSTFIGNVDSVRLDFRTKDIQRMSISATGNVGIGTISPTAQLHATGPIRLAALTSDSNAAYPRILVSDSTGKLAYQPVGNVDQTVGGGLGITGTNTLTLGDSIAGPGAHSFTASRNQYLNGYFYSIGGSVNSPVNAPNLGWYNNGDWVSGTTMNRSVNTQAKTGLRYYSKIGTLQLGASDRLDTMRTQFITGSWQGTGLVMNSDDSNSGGPRMINTIYLSDVSHVDTSVTFFNSLVALEASTIDYPGSLTNSLFSGYGQYLTAPISNSVVFGQSDAVTHPANGLFLGGYSNASEDTAEYSIVAGSDNQFGGIGQLVVGQYLKNRTPFGAALGNGNVAFTSLSYTGTRGVTVSGIAGYPLLAIGNASGTGIIASDAVTVLYNGRTQINTTGFSGSLTQTAVTPKAAFEVVSTNTGVLFPLLTQAQQSAIASTDRQTGLLLYNTDAGCFQYYTGSAWQPVGSSASLANKWQNLGNSATSPGSNFVGTTDVESLVFRTDNDQQLTITANGAVGIGIAAPQAGAKLAVNGTIYAQKIEATMTGWADGVFGPGYALMTLPSLKQYIEQHRRLPGVVSANYAARQGLDLGDNQVILLQKVEELTLYLIEAHKKTAERQEVIDQLKASAGRLDAQQKELAELRQKLMDLTSHQP